VTSLAEDVKLSTCGRHSSLFLLSFDFVICFCFFQVKCLPPKFGGAFSYVLPNLHHPSGIVFLGTLGTLCHFWCGGRVDTITFLCEYLLFFVHICCFCKNFKFFVCYVVDWA
jgi:hypothetical protein